MEFPDTRASLLVQVRNPENAEAWEQFVGLYQPVVYRLARQRGLQDADACDLVQSVFVSISGSIQRWEQQDEKTRFRFWLRKVVRHAILNVLMRRPHDVAAGGTTVHQLLDRHPQSDNVLEEQIETEYRRQIYQQASNIVQADVHPDTWRVFQRTVLEGMSIHAASKELGKPVGAIYTARSRVMRRLRETVQQLEESHS